MTDTPKTDALRKVVIKAYKEDKLTGNGMGNILAALANIETLERERDNALSDAKQADTDSIRALAERNEAREQLAAERALADRLADALSDIQAKCCDTSIALHPDADAKGCVDDCWEWSEQALAAWGEARATPAEKKSDFS